jgi:hypothetical protein
LQEFTQFYMTPIKWGIQSRRRQDYKALDSLTGLVREKPQNRASRYQLARAAFEQWLQTDQLPSTEVSTLLADYLAQPEQVTSCDDASLAARLAMMHGDRVLAASYTSYRAYRVVTPNFVGQIQPHKGPKRSVMRFLRANQVPSTCVKRAAPCRHKGLQCALYAPGCDNPISTVHSNPALQSSSRDGVKLSYPCRLTGLEVIAASLQVSSTLGSACASVPLCILGRTLNLRYPKCATH